MENYQQSTPLHQQRINLCQNTSVVTYITGFKLPSKIPQCCYTLSNFLWLPSKIAFINFEKLENKQKSLCIMSFPTSLTIDRFLMAWVHKVPWVLDGILEVPDSMWAVPLTPHAFLSCLCLFLTFWEPVLLRTGTWKRNTCDEFNEVGVGWGSGSSLNSGFLQHLLPLKKPKHLFHIYGCRPKPITRKITMSIISGFQTCSLKQQIHF